MLHDLYYIADCYSPIKKERVLINHNLNYSLWDMSFKFLIKL